MQIIAHRINTMNLLKDTPKSFGVEIDIRSNGDELILHHDPFIQGELLHEWIQHFNHGTLILNVKEEGLESRLLDLMSQYRIEDFFFLDQSFPFLRKTALMGERRCAVRVSEYEDIKTALSISKMIDWVWVDCFSNFPLNIDQVLELQNSGLKLCIVSPELHGRTSTSRILNFRNQTQLLGIEGGAVCTKHADLWA
tara:strand:- start:655 stop:1242 length:588 start_codon:yes stop_codon:yes gene_type:complete